MEEKEEQSRFVIEVGDLKELENGANMTDAEIRHALAERKRIMDDICNGVYDDEEEKEVLNSVKKSRG